jgi:CHAT domain-containing protein
VLEYWKLDAELLALSACESALGRQGGDGLLGFAQAFLLAGSRAVCLTLWEVDDTATALLMDRFYRNLLAKRQDGAKPMRKAAALHEAKHWLRTLSASDALARLGALTNGVVRGERPHGSRCAPSRSRKTPPWTTNTTHTPATGRPSSSSAIRIRVARRSSDKMVAIIQVAHLIAFAWSLIWR